MNLKKNNNRYVTFIDSHVHIHNCYNLKNFFDSPFRNFDFYREKLSDSKKFIGVLFFAEAGNNNFFEKFFNEPEIYSKKISYLILKTSEDVSLNITDGINNIILIAGQQIVTAENLEVLALGTRKRFEYKKNISETISLINDSDAIPVIPWGVGKWTGKRERVVKELINMRADFFLGDNGNRPAFWDKPSIFKLAELKGIYNLPGSDPLNFESEITKPGSFGFYFDEKIDLDYPVKDLKQKILENKSQFNTYGKLESPLKFFRNQISIQINKRIRKS